MKHKQGLINRLVPLMAEFSDTLADSGLSAHPTVVLSERDWNILQIYGRAQFPHLEESSPPQEILSIHGVYFVQGNDV